MLTLWQMRRLRHNTIERAVADCDHAVRTKRSNLHSLTSEGANFTVRVQLSEYLFKRSGAA